MDWDKVKTENPETFKKISEWVTNVYSTNITQLAFRFTIAMVQEFFAMHSVYVWIEKRVEGWVVKVNDATKDNYKYENIYNAWEIAFYMAFEKMECRYKEQDLSEFTAQEVHNLIIGTLPERQKKFNNFNANLTALRKNKLKNFIFTEHIDWFKNQNKVCYTHSGLKKIKQYFSGIKIR